MKRLRNSQGVKSLCAGLLLIVAIASTCKGDLGGWITFGSTQEGDWDIWAVRPDGTGLKQLTNLPGMQLEPQWSPDSRKIMYTSSGPSGGGTRSQLWVYDWATGTSTKIYDAHDYQGQNLGSFDLMQPSWSPDGNKILFREDSSYNNPHITLINADGTGRQIVPAQSGFVTHPSWALNGKAFVYDRRNSGLSYTHDLWVYDFTQTGDILSGTNHRLTQGAGSESTTKNNPDWMPGGDIVFTWGHNLAIIDPGHSPTWGNPASPDVTFLTNEGTYEEASWSPDLSHLIYERSLNGNYDLWTMDLTTQAQTRVISLPGDQANPDWGNPVPVPGAVLLGYLGFATALGVLRRHRTKQPN